MKSQVPVLGIIGGLLLIVTVFPLAFMLLEAPLTRGLSEEKSYFTHDGTNHRLRPELRGQKWNLETWDDAEEIAHSVFANGPTGVWATWSDHLTFLPRRLQLDRGRREMCVIRIDESVYVVRGVKKKVAQCAAIRPGFAVSDVTSGELAPSSDGVAEIYFQQATH